MTSTRRTALPTTSSLSHCRGITFTYSWQMARPGRASRTQSRPPFPPRCFGRCSTTGTPSYARISHVQADLRGRDPARRTVAVTGSSGLVGTALCAFLTTAGHRVIRLVRRAPHTDDERTWNPDDPDPGVFEEVDAVVHLAGSSIAGRFTEAHKRSISSSRIEPTRRLVDAMVRVRASASPPRRVGDRVLRPRPGRRAGRRRSRARGWLPRRGRRGVGGGDRPCPRGRTACRDG